MGTRTAAWLAWSVWALCVVLLALTILLDHLYTPPGTNKGNGNVHQFFGIPMLVYATVGAFVASRRPGNLVGWLMYAIGLVLAIWGFSVPYADYALLAEPAFPLPDAVYMACVSQSVVALPTMIAVVTLLILFFPNGRLPNRGFRAVPWVVIGGGATSALWALTANDFYGRYSLVNPLWAEGALAGAVEGFGGLGATAIVSCFAAAVIALFVRLGNARGAERQQLKWFSYAATVLLTLILFSPLVAWFLPGWVAFPSGIVGLSAPAVAVGIAVLRYRLYDIDRIINRTVVYGPLTGILALVYFGGVTATQAIFQTFTGQEELPQLIIVASTLAIAALFSPLRRRIQSFIDRRFYRRKYDAAKTLATLNARLRDETELDTLSGDVVGVVGETMQPAHISMWIRPESASRGQQTD